MPEAIKDKMVSSRVSAQIVDTASSVLKERGITVSSFIRNSLNYVAREGEVPECGIPSKQETGSLSELKKTLRHIEQQSMPGKADYADLSEDQLIERLMMEKHGY